MKESSSVNDLPLHEQLRTTLAHEIESGAYGESGRLPPEPQLGKRFGVSRITVRRAVAELEASGLVQRRQGRGTFVTPRKVSVGAMTLGGFTDQFVSLSGHHPTRKVLLKEEVPADEATARALAIAVGDPVLHLIRSFSLDGQALSIDESRYSLERFPGFAEKIDATASTYQLLREDYGVTFAEVRREIGIGFTTARSAEWLNRPEHDPLIVIDKVVTDTAGVIVHTSRVECVPSRTSLTLVAKADQ